MSEASEVESTLGGTALTDEQILLEDGAVSVTLGRATVRVDALPIRASAQWSKQCALAIAQSQQQDLALLPKADGKTDEKELIAGAVTNLVKLLKSKDFVPDALVLCDLLAQHSKVLDKTLLDKATTSQIVDAFRKVHDLENPTAALQLAMQKAIKT